MFVVRALGSVEKGRSKMLVVVVAVAVVVVVVMSNAPLKLVAE